MESGITGDSSVLLTKSILDFLTPLIFAPQLVSVVSAIAVPQCNIYLTLFFLSGVIVPLTTPEMINDFSAYGGVIIIATGFRALQVKRFPTVDMIISMILVMPMSWDWAEDILLLIS